MVGQLVGPTDLALNKMLRSSFVGSVCLPYCVWQGLVPDVNGVYCRQHSSTRSRSDWMSPEQVGSALGCHAAHSTVAWRSRLTSRLVGLKVSSGLGHDRDRNGERE